VLPKRLIFKTLFHPAHAGCQWSDSGQNQRAMEQEDSKGASGPAPFKKAILLRPENIVNAYLRRVCSERPRRCNGDRVKKELLEIQVAPKRR
jgi:hypothetical protein